jgi:hypothetical protein
MHTAVLSHGQYLYRYKNLHHLGVASCLKTYASQLNSTGTLLSRSKYCTVLVLESIQCGSCQLSQDLCITAVLSQGQCLFLYQNINHVGVAICLKTYASSCTFTRSVPVLVLESIQCGSIQLSLDLCIFHTVSTCTGTRINTMWELPAVSRKMHKSCTFTRSVPVPVQESIPCGSCQLSQNLCITAEQYPAFTR